ncbi:hypothetical protein HK405_010942 [Cladochytrium tenue]|nr:hypothetical protein HK405_010942 [Cladochytrium tenue]
MPTPSLRSSLTAVRHSATATVRTVAAGDAHELARRATGAVAAEGCVENIALKLTSVYETSSQSLQWGVCGTLADGHGYSAGIVQFTTGTGSAEAVIEDYWGRVGSNNEFSAYNATLEALAAAYQTSGELQGSTAGLDGFCDAWASAAAKSAFQTAQLDVFETDYWIPSQNLAVSFGLTHALARAQVFDSTIQLGLQGTNQLGASIGKVGSNESEWLMSFLQAREAKLQSMGSVYAATVTRVQSYMHALDTGNLDFAGNQVEALDNDGNVITVTCDASVAATATGKAGWTSSSLGGSGGGTGLVFSGGDARGASLVAVAVGLACWAVMF